MILLRFIRPSSLILSITSLVLSLLFPLHPLIASQKDPFRILFVSLSLLVLQLFPSEASFRPASGAIKQWLWAERDYFVT